MPDTTSDTTAADPSGAELPPALVLLSGLPATGKSWIGRRVAARLGAELTSSDQRRLDLFGRRRPDEPRGPYDQGRYAADAKQRVYDLLLEDARRALLSGRSIVVDGSFLQRVWRAPFARLAAELQVPFCLVEVFADEETVQRRLAERALDPNEASEADWAVYTKLAARVEPADELPADQRIAWDGTAEFEACFADLLARLARQQV